MFSGVFQHAIDAKGRTSLPARFRELLAAQKADKLFITPDLLDPCLVAFAPAAWQRLAEKVAARSIFDRDIRLLSRAFIAPAQECPVDKGTFVPNVTDDFTGAAPDLGALEVGRPLPHYGPRN